MARQIVIDMKLDDFERILLDYTLDSKDLNYLTLPKEKIGVLDYNIRKNGPCPASIGGGSQSPAETGCARTNVDVRGVATRLKNGSFKLVFQKKDRLNGTFQLPLTYLDCSYYVSKPNKITVNYSIKKMNAIKLLLKLTAVIAVVYFILFLSVSDMVIDTLIAILPILIIEIIVLFVPNYKEAKKLLYYLNNINTIK